MIGYTIEPDKFMLNQHIDGPFSTLWILKAKSFVFIGAKTKASKQIPIKKLKYVESFSPGKHRLFNKHFLYCLDKPQAKMARMGEFSLVNWRIVVT